MATFELTSEATIRFIADLADFFLVRLPARAALFAGCKEERQEQHLLCRRAFCSSLGWILDLHLSHEQSKAESVLSSVLK